MKAPGTSEDVFRPTAPPMGIHRLLSIAWPLVLHGLVTVLVAGNDVLLLGGAGAVVVASAVVSSSVLMVLVMALGAFSVSTQIEGSRARGSGSDDERHAVEGTLRIIVPVTLAITAAGMLIAPRMTSLIGGDAAAVAISGAYLRITLLGLPFAVLASVFRAYATASGRTRVVLVVGLLTAGTDVAVSLALNAAIGWHGVAVGTVCGYLVSATGFLWWRHRLTGAQRPRWRARPVGNERVLFKLGWPESLLALFSSASGLVVVIVLRDSSAEVLTGSRLLDVQLMFSWVVLGGIGQALLTMLGEAAGGDRRADFAAAVRNAAILMAAVSFALYIGVAPWSAWIIGTAAGDEVRALVEPFAWLWWLQVGWQAACALLGAVCRSLRDTRTTLMASLVGEYAVFLPLGLLLCVWLSMDLLGVLIAHHAFWATFIVIAAVRARAAVRRELAPSG